LLSGPSRRAGPAAALFGRSACGRNRAWQLTDVVRGRRRLRDEVKVIAKKKRPEDLTRCDSQGNRIQMR
jgi:hypothetical protein